LLAVQAQQVVSQITTVLRRRQRRQQRLLQQQLITLVLDGLRVCRQVPI
jgi:very-short-patch-repair endonuclease